jgi:hypothetical protein
MSHIQDLLYKEPAGQVRRNLVRQWLLDQVDLLRSVPQGGLTAIGESSRPPFCLRCCERHWQAKELTCMPLPTRAATVASSGSSSSSALAAGAWKAFPELWGFLTYSALPDGTKRPTGRLSFSCGPVGLVLSLSDDHTASYATLTGRSLDDLLAAAELGLESSTLDWRPSQFKKGKR